MPEQLIVHAHERILQHAENLRLWREGFLDPTEPDPEERAAVKGRLEGAIHALEEVKTWAESNRDKT